MVEIQWETPLHQHIASYAPASGDSGVEVREWPQSGLIILRGQADNPAFLGKSAAALRCALPVKARATLHHDNLRILRLSPDEWLLVCPYRDKEALRARLDEALQGVHAQVVDNSGGYTALVLYGEQRERVLRHLTPFDVASLAIHDAAGTVISKSHVILTRPDAQSHEIIVRRSFADYVWKLLVKAARPYGLAIRPHP